jgi:hypothetical protein
MVLRRIFGRKRDKLMGEWRKLHSGQLHNLYSSPNTIRQIKSRKYGGQGMWHAWEWKENIASFWWESQKEKDSSKDRGVGGRMESK